MARSSTATASSLRQLDTEFGLFKYNEPEQIPLEQNIDDIQAKRPFDFRVDRLYSWPGQRLAFEFTYSNPGQRWLWSVYRIRTDGTLEELFRSPCILDRPYRHRDIFVMLFRSPAGSRYSKIDHTNLGQGVTLNVYPLDESDAYPFDLSEA